ncbi:hypothetical protein BKA66DRAFT_466001 [Pyrenochaeta sp. MPI-SDFR-AT-0127]|nr:hypothetical protein BKA66DRAFT_466001 [Pyrenochaeta sp. MPI-SDFR-AT-0127]
MAQCFWPVLILLLETSGLLLCGFVTENANCFAGPRTPKSMSERSVMHSTHFLLLNSLDKSWRTQPSSCFSLWLGYIAMVRAQRRS